LGCGQLGETLSNIKWNRLKYSPYFSKDIGLICLKEMGKLGTSEDLNKINTSSAVYF
jgi:hypothetical protein